MKKLRALRLIIKFTLLRVLHSLLKADSFYRHPPIKRKIYFLKFPCCVGKKYAGILYFKSINVYNI